MAKKNANSALFWYNLEAAPTGMSMTSDLLFRIERVSTNTPIPGRTHHYHDSYEIYYLYSGDRYYFIKDKTYHVKRGGRTGELSRYRKYADCWWRHKIFRCFHNGKSAVGNEVLFTVNTDLCKFSTSGRSKPHYF